MLQPYSFMLGCNVSVVNVLLFVPLGHTNVAQIKISQTQFGLRRWWNFVTPSFSQDRPHTKGIETSCRHAIGDLPICFLHSVIENVFKAVPGIEASGATKHLHPHTRQNKNQRFHPVQAATTSLVGLPCSKLLHFHHSFEGRHIDSQLGCWRCGFTPSLANTRLGSDEYQNSVCVEAAE